MGGNMGIMNRNCKARLLEWVTEIMADNKTNLPWVDKKLCTTAAKIIINKGGLRGDVSDKWKALGFTTEQIPGMLV